MNSLVARRTLFTALLLLGSGFHSVVSQDSGPADPTPDASVSGYAPLT
jgi:hypothetical protein